MPVIPDWHDPENLALHGRGCWLCHLAPPVVKLRKYALCVDCLCCWFPGRSRESVIDWLIAQAERAVALLVKREPEGWQLVLELVIEGRYDATMAE